LPRFTSMLPSVRVHVPSHSGRIMKSVSTGNAPPLEFAPPGAPLAPPFAPLLDVPALDEPPFGPVPPAAPAPLLLPEPPLQELPAAPAPLPAAPPDPASPPESSVGGMQPPTPKVTASVPSKAQRALLGEGNVIDGEVPRNRTLGREVQTDD